MTETPDVRGLARGDRGRATASIPLPPRRWKTRLLLPLAVAGVILALVLYSSWDVLMPTTPVRAVPVIVKSMASGAPGSVTVQAPGWLEPDPHPYAVTALTAGVVAEVLVLEGDAVAQDQVVARLIDEDALLARDRTAAALEERRAQSAAADATLRFAKQSLETLVRPQELVARARAERAAVDAEKVRLEARVRAAQSTLRATEDEVERKARLVDSQAVSRGAFERLRMRVDAERAQLEAVRAELPVLDAKTASADAQLSAAERDMELLIGERRAVAMAEAELDACRASERAATTALAQAELRVARTAVRAPLAGVVMRRAVSPGSTLRASGAPMDAVVVELYDPKKLQVRVDIPLADAAQVGMGQRAEIVVDSLPDQIFEGVVTRLVHIADVAKNTVEVKVAVHEPVSLLKPQMLARVRFLAARQEDGEAVLRQRIFAPRSAVMESGDGRSVFVVAELKLSRGTVARREIELGNAVVDDYVEVASGLRPGDQVILNAPPGLEPGTRVSIEGGER